MLKDVGKKVGKVAKDTTKKSGELLEKTKLKLKIKKEEDAIKELYTQIGMKYYNSYISSEDVGDKVKNLCDNIKEREDIIVELYEEIDDIN